jgi:hypothetical protein
VDVGKELGSDWCGYEVGMDDENAGCGRRDPCNVRTIARRGLSSGAAQRQQFAVLHSERWLDSLLLQ